MRRQIDSARSRPCSRYMSPLIWRNSAAFLIRSFIAQAPRRRSKPAWRRSIIGLSSAVPVNPAASVRGARHVIKKGKTPVLSWDEARRLLDSIDISTDTGLRDRALIGLMVHSFARVGAGFAMKVEGVFM
jgi:integrase